MRGGDLLLTGNKRHHVPETAKLREAQRSERITNGPQFWADGIPLD